MAEIAETIRGITVNLEANTTGLQAALKDVNKNAKDIASELRQVERLLKFNPKDTELLAQKQKLLSDQINNTREKLNRLRAAQSQVNEQFQKGDITEGQYRAFQRELIKTESQLKHFEAQLKNSTSTSEQFAKKMQEVGERLKSVGDKMSSVGKSLSTKLTAPILGATTALVGIVKKTAEAGDEIQKMSQRTGLSATALSELKHAAELSGTTLDSLETAVKRMQRSVLDLERGLSTQTEAFEMLGLTIEDVQGLSPEEQFNKITSALADVEGETRKAALAQQIFGRSGTELLPMLSQGADGLAEMRQEAHELGVVFDEEAANNSAAFNDAITRLKGAFTGVFQELGKKLIPVFTNDLIPALKESLIPLAQSLADKISGLIEWFSNLSPRMQKIIIAVTGLAAVLGPVLMVLGPIVTAIGTLTPMLGGLATAIAGISAPAIGAVAAIAAFAAIAVEVYRNWEEVKSALISIWDLIKASAVQLGLNIAIAFEEMKATVLNTINAMLDKLGVLEKLPFGIGDKFKGLNDNISDSAEASAQKIAELKKAAEENGKRVSAAVEGTKVAFSDLGNAVKEDIQGVIGAITGQTKTIEEEQIKQTEITVEENQKRTESTKENEQEQTETVSEEAQKRAELREEFEKSWNDKLFQLTASRLEQLDKEKEEALAKAEELGADKAAIYEYYAIKRQEILDEELAKEQEREQKRLDTLAQFEQEWANKLFEATATNLEILEKEKQEALAKAEELGANKADIIKYYAIKEQEILDEQRKKEEEARQREIEAERQAAEEKNRLRLEFEQSWNDKLFELTATKEELLEREKERALQRAEELGASKQAILEYYAQKERELMESQAEFYKGYGDTMSTIIGTWKDTVTNYVNELKTNTEQASMSAADAIVSFADTVVSGEKTLKEALKEMLLNIITTLEQQVIAQQLAGIAISWAQAPATFGASLAWIPQIAAAVAPALATFEAVKAVIRGLETGGIVTGPTLALVGEGKDDEAVLPLNKQTLSALGASIATNMPQQQVVAQRPIEVKLQIGTLIADELGLKKLERKLQSIRMQENLRLGVSAN